MKKLLLAGTALAFLIASSSCKKEIVPSDAKKELVIGPTVDTLRGEITVNTTVTRTTYLQGLVYVVPGVTLTVNPGVTIIGSPGPVIPDTVNLENNKGALMIERGGKLVSNGTPTSPIVWTSSKAPGTRAFGDWGGVVLYGKATIHRADGASTGLFEAFDYKPDERNRYGGVDDHDNSGSITYNRFEFGGGIIYQANKEVNGFTMCGVGDGTVFHHNEILYAGDDGIEFFGGSVNINHIVVYQAHDDDYDFDEGFHGSLQFIIAYRVNNADNSGSHIIESDNDANSTSVTPHTSAFIANATFVGPSATKLFATSPSSYYDGALQIRRNSRIKLVNSIISTGTHPYALMVGPTTKPLVASIPSNSDSIIISYNIWESPSAHPVVLNATAGDGNPILVPPSTDDAQTLARLSTPENANSVVPNFAALKLDGALKPLPGSPALGGGVNLFALGLTQFTGTTERGAVRSVEPWTTTGTWISIADN